MAKKILYISYDGMTDPLGQSQVLPYLAGLTQLGCEFTILSFEKKDRFETEKNIIQDLAAQAGIRWIPLTFTSNPPFVSKLYDKLRMRRTAVQLHKKYGFDIIHCRSYISAETGLYLKQHYQIPFLFDMRGFWPDERVDNLQWPQHNPLFRYLYNLYKRKEIIFLREAAAVVALTQAAKKEINSWPSFGQLDIDIIPCCADLQHFNFHDVSANSTARLKQTLNILPSSKIITYLGSFGGPYMTDEMLTFFKQLSTSDPNYMMVFYSKDNPDTLISEIEKHGIPAEKIRVTYVKRQDLPLYLSISDFSLFFIRNTYSKIASSPTKHAELMGMGIPVICNTIGDTGSIVSSTQTGILIERFDEAGYADAIRQMSTFSVSKEVIRKTAFDYFNLESGIQKYFAAYQKIKPLL